MANGASAERGAAQFAILDLDGTLLPGTASVQFVKDLLAAGICRREAGLACLRAIERLAKAEKTPLVDRSEAYRCYAAALAGVRYEEARLIAARTWETCRSTLFSFVDRLIELLRANHFDIYLISGSADLVIQQVVAQLGFTWGCGTVTEAVKGEFTRRITCAPGLPGGKATVMRKLITLDGFDRGTAIAIGNSGLDKEVFLQVDSAIAFEPDGDLRTSAERHNWHVADRQTILGTCTRLIHALP